MTLKISLTSLLMMVTPGILVSCVSGSALRGGDGSSSDRLLIEGILDEMAELADNNRALMEQNKELMDEKNLQQQQHQALIKNMLDEMVQLADQNKDLMEGSRAVAEHNRELVNDKRLLQAQATGEVFARRVFATSETYAANGLGGLPGADEKCQKLANTANLGGIYKAWLSDNTGTPSSRFYKSPGPYVRVDGKVIANNWNDLTDNNTPIKAPIKLDENGNELASGSGAFTGTGTRGGNAGDTCYNWSSIAGSDYGAVGRLHKTNSDWSQDVSNAFCGLRMHLYCFEQYPTSS